MGNEIDRVAEEGRRMMTADPVAAAKYIAFADALVQCAYNASAAYRLIHPNCSPRSSRVSAVRYARHPIVVAHLTDLRRIAFELLCESLLKRAAVGTYVIDSAEEYGALREYLATRIEQRLMTSRRPIRDAGKLLAPLTDLTRYCSHAVRATMVGVHPEPAVAAPRPTPSAPPGKSPLLRRLERRKAAGIPRWAAN
jgi:hypothetical protein